MKSKRFEPSAEERRFIQDHYKGKSTQDLIAEMEKEFHKKYDYEKIRGYKKRNKLASGFVSRFQKGIVPYTKGKTWNQYMSPEGQKRARSTAFVKGTRPHNYLPVGSEKLRKQKNGCYWFVKVAPGAWALKQRVIYEKLYGPIPKGKVVSFLDGDFNNFDPDNLILIDQAENGYLNSSGLRLGDKELVQAAICLQRIDKKVKELRKDAE